MSDASQELAESDTGAFLALILALGAGLRRGEIDKLLWRQVNAKNCAISIEVTEAGSLKSADSTGQVHIDATLATILQGFKAKATSKYVIEAEESSTNTTTWSRKYRCQGVFDRLISWLREHGVQGRSPLHVLRKEAGSLIATEHGIYAASRFLRHADLHEAFKKGDAAARAALFAEDAILLGRTGPIKGRKAIAKYYTDLFQKVHFIENATKYDKDLPTS